jgi:hypothetical protein
VLTDAPLFVADGDGLPIAGLSHSAHSNAFSAILYGAACVEGTAPPAFAADPDCAAWKNGLLLTGLKACVAA